MLFFLTFVCLMYNGYNLFLLLTTFRPYSGGGRFLEIENALLSIVSLKGQKKTHTRNPVFTELAPKPFQSIMREPIKKKPLNL